MFWEFPSLIMKIFTMNYISVVEFYWRVHENFQSNLYDAFNRPLERLSPVLGSNAPGLSKRLLGLHKRIKGTSDCPH